jgi:hypothetical protein
MNQTPRNEQSNYTSSGGIAQSDQDHNFYEASHIKKTRSTKADMQRRNIELLNIVSEIHPCTVRQCFYQAEVRGIIEKTETGYSKVQRALAEMRRSGDLPYDWIADNTRWQRKPASFDSPKEAVAEVAIFYRKNLWRDAGEYVEIWLEKDALSGVVYPVTAEYDVPLMVARGYSSLSFLYSSAEYISSLRCPAYIYHLGDFDPSGVNAAHKIESTLRELAPNAEIIFKRLAVLPHQIDDWNLPTRPTKKTDSRSKKFGSEISVELDSIHPDKLRQLVTDAIESHLPRHEFEILKKAEASEREMLKYWANTGRRF